MEKIKISSLGILDEQKFKKLANEREDFVNSGDDMLLTDVYGINKIAEELEPQRILVSISRIFKENEEYKTIQLSSKDGESLPTFRAGQKISVILSIKGKYYTKPYTIVSSPRKSLDGEYRITIKNDHTNIVDEYLFNKAKIGERITISSPFGDFYYSKIRDKNNILAIVGDYGIMPIYSMAQAILDGTLNVNMIIFYTEKKESDLLYKDELIDIASKTSKIKLKLVLSEEMVEGMTYGFVTSSLIKSEIDDNHTTIFISGSEGLLKYLDKELEELKLPKKFIRYENFLPVCNIKRVSQYNLSIYINNEKYDIPCYNNKTIMQSLMEGGVYIPSKCHNGSCGFCRSELVLGEVKIVNDKRTIADKKYNFIHPCTTYPLSDIEIIVR